MNIPIGSDHPMIYFLGDKNTDKDINEVPFTSETGQLFRAMLSAVGLNENNCRFHNMYDSEGNKDPECIQDIINANPKVLVLLGSNTIKEFGIKGGINNTRGTVINCSNIAAIPMFHPYYALNSENQTDKMNFKADIKLAMELAANDDLRIKKMTGEDKQNNLSTTILCKTYDEFDKFCKQYIDNAEYVAYDVETNAKEVHSLYHRIVGFSLAPNKDIGCYVPLDTLDYHFSQIDKIRVKERMRSIVKKNMIVYNCLHEFPVTYNWLNTNLGHTDDVFVMVKLMYSSSADRYVGHRGLKEQSVTHLNYKDWSRDLDSYFRYVTNYDNNGRCNMVALLSKYYEGNELTSIMNEVDNFVSSTLPTLDIKQTISYEYVPCNLIGRYGSIDSSVLFELKAFYEDWMDKEGSELGINLHQGYEYWMRHHYCGYVLEKNGAYWNDEKADKLEEWCTTGMHDRLRNLIMSPLSRDIVKKNTYSTFISYLKDNYIDKILGFDYTLKRKYKTSIDIICNNAEAEQRLRNMSLLPKVAKNGTKTYKLEDGHIEYMASSVLKDKSIYDNWFNNFFQTISSPDRTIDEYKAIINPTATATEWKDAVSDIVVTNEIRVAKFYKNIVELTEEPGFDIDYYKDFYNERLEDYDNNPKLTWKFDIAQFKREHVEYTYHDNDDSKLVELVNSLRQDENLSPSMKYRMFTKTIANAKLTNKKLKRALSSAQSYKLATLDAGMIFEVYELWQMLGIDPENKDTWNDRFKWLVDYKLFKKYNKIISTYIKGVTGRANTYYVDAKSYTEGDYMTRREGLYDGLEHPGKVTMMQQKFSVNAADTGRWKCFRGDTKIKCLDGNSYTFEELANSSIDKFWIYAIDLNTKSVVPAQANKPFITNYVSKMLRVTLDNGEVFECTPDHRIMLLDGTYKEAQYLTEDDSIMPLYLREDSNGYLQYKDIKSNDYINVHSMVNKICNNDIEDLKLKAATYNHSIIRTELIEYSTPIPVYDICVDNYHNFALDCGIFVHNCAMHNVPAGESVKGIYTSRFNGGCIAMPDGCLTGDTRIRLADGTSPRIDELVDYDKFYVYSYDESTNKYVIAKGHSCREVKRVNKLYKIKFNNGESVTCTTDHKFYSNDLMKMVEANKLTVGSSLSYLDIRRKYDNFGKEREYVHHPNGQDEYTYHLVDSYNVEQSLYDDTVYELGYINRHHIDFNPDNNSPENIARLSPQEHGRIHGTEIWKNKEYREHMTESAKRQWTDDEYRNMMLNVSRTKGADSFRKCNYDRHCIELRRNGNRNKYNDRFLNTMYELINVYNIPIRELLISNDYDSIIRSIYGKCKKGCGIRTILSQDMSLYDYILSNLDKLLVDKDIESVREDLEFINSINESAYSRKELSQMTNNYRKCDEYCKDNYIALDSSNFYDIQDKINLGMHKRHKDTIDKYFGNFDNYTRYAKDNHYIISIEELDVDNIPVYCFQVDIYHNYYLDCGVLSSNSQMEIRLLACESQEEHLFKAFEDGLDIHKFFASKIFATPYDEVQKWQRGLAKNAVFGIVYGMSEQSFADSYLAGDVDRAKQIFDDMFTSFPKIKDYVNRKHMQFEKYGKVTTITQRFLRLDESATMDHNTLLRQSQNFPIQAAAEDLAGLIMYEFIKWLEDNNMKSKPFCFIHDSIEVDLHPDEVFQCIEKFNYLFNVYPRETFGAPVECDVPIGPSMGQECKTSDMIHDEDYNDVTLTLEGIIEEIEEVLDSWRKVYKLVEVLPDYQDEDKDKYEPFGATFLAKKSPVSIYAGQHRIEGKRRIHVIRK